MSRRRVPDVRAVLRLARHLRARHPDVVHAHMVHANLMARACRPLAPVPVLVCTAHSPFEGGRAYDLAYRASDRWCNLTTNVSPQAVARYVASGAVPSAERIQYVPNGIDVAGYGPRLDAQERRVLLAELAVPPDRFVWLCAGRLAVEKDLGTLLRALRRAIDVDPRHHLLLAGTGDERGDLERIAADLGVTEHVAFLGYRDDIVRLMRGVDGYVLSSAWEGLPMVLLEASACRLPAVTTRVGGTTEIVLEGETGLVVRAGRPERPRPRSGRPGRTERIGARCDGRGRPAPRRRALRPRASRRPLGGALPDCADGTRSGSGRRTPAPSPLTHRRSTGRLSRRAPRPGSGARYRPC